MDKIRFNDLLKIADLSKKEFAGLIGTSGPTVNNWGSSGRAIPYWVESWLNLYNENKNLKQIKQLIQDSGLNK
ncbi:hypothetical protein A9Q76_00670 [Arcobacter sp. 31_11_sub10_T18]|nr:hypothetical protein A9Q76_00670 [Arcobacter sp. 31_11_sub10_T18]